ncbi:MAG: hypothetical protein JWN91_2712 [Nocardioides sp.]|jgi:hypothetical protein|nr:hypothetical protein [Nocardioides sp.]
MTDDQWLRDHLTSSVPEPPSAPGRADAARRRARAARRRTAAVVATAGAVAVVAVVAPLALGGSGSSSPAPAAPTTSATTVTPEDVACPAGGTQPEGPGTLPDGAVGVRLCQGSGMTFQGPADALVTDVDALIDLVNEQPVLDMSGGCTMELGRGYVLAFAYPDGSIRTVAGQLYGCEPLTVGGVVRSNAELPWNRFNTLLAAQRRELDPPGDATTTVSCGDAADLGLSPVGRAGEMTSAVLCANYETASDQGPQQAAVPADDLAILLADRVARRRDTAAPPESCSQPADLRLLGVTAWGDVTETYLWCGLWSDERGHYWRPGADAQRILDRLVEEAGSPTPTVDAGSSAEDVVAAYVDLLNAGDRSGAAALWHPVAGPPDLPTMYSRVDYKVEGVKSLPRISAWRDATLVRALYREQIRDAYVPYRETSFTLGRDEEGVFRIVSMQLGDVVETGR